VTLSLGDGRPRTFWKGRCSDEPGKEEGEGGASLGYTRGGGGGEVDLTNTQGKERLAHFVGAKGMRTAFN